MPDQNQNQNQNKNQNPGQKATPGQAQPNRNTAPSQPSQDNPQRTQPQQPTSRPGQTPSSGGFNSGKH